MNFSNLKRWDDQNHLVQLGFYSNPKFWIQFQIFQIQVISMHSFRLKTQKFSAFWAHGMVTKGLWGYVDMTHRDWPGLPVTTFFLQVAKWKKQLPPSFFLFIIIFKKKVCMYLSLKKQTFISKLPGWELVFNSSTFFKSITTIYMCRAQEKEVTCRAF